MGDLLLDDDCDVSLHRLVFGHRLRHRHLTGRDSIERQLKHHGRADQIPRLPPARVQLAHMTYQNAIKQYLSRASGVHGRVFCGHKFGLTRGQELFHIGLDVVKIDLTGLALPAQWLDRSPGHTGHTHGLVKPFHGGVAALHRSIAQKHAP